MKSLSLIIIILLSSSLRSEMINLECKTQTQNSERTNTFSLLLGTETKKAVQILKKGQLTMDLSIREDYFEVGQFTDASQTDLIVVSPYQIRQSLKGDLAKGDLVQRASPSARMYRDDSCQNPLIKTDVQF